MSDGETPIPETAESQEAESSEHPTEFRASWGIAEVLMGIFASLLLGVIAVLIFKATASDPDRLTLPGVFAAVLGGWIAYAGTPYLVARNLPGGLAQQMGLRFKWRDDLWRGILLGIAGQVLVVLVYTPLHLLTPGLVDNLDGPAKELTDTVTSWRWLVFGTFVVVISPICEELFFRGLTMRAIASRWGATAGIVASGIVFGLIHFEPVQTIALAGFGMLLAYRATKTGRIGETIIGHATFNLITVLALLFGIS
jgi:membrane protease YdiL (CAAX protease family)